VPAVDVGAMIIRKTVRLLLVVDLVDYTVGSATGCPQSEELVSKRVADSPRSIYERAIMNSTIAAATFSGRRASDRSAVAVTTSR